MWHVIFEFNNAGGGQMLSFYTIINGTSNIVDGASDIITAISLQTEISYKT